MEYFVYSLIFLSLWGVIFYLRGDLRRKMLLTSTVIAPMGPLSQIWYLQDYWRPTTITGYHISIEDVIFSFSLGGITFALFKLLFRQTLSSQSVFPRRYWLMPTFVGLIIIALYGFPVIIHTNSVVATSIAFIGYSVLIWIIRPDLRRPSIITGVVSLLVFIIVYNIMLIIYPDLMSKWCTTCNPSGYHLLRVNIEELVWDFSWGLVGGVVYEAVSGKQLIPMISDEGNNGV